MHFGASICDVHKCFGFLFDSSFPFKIDLNSKIDKTALTLSSSSAYIVYGSPLMTHFLAEAIYIHVPSSEF